MDQGIVLPGWETVRRIGRGATGAVYEIQRKSAAGTERAALRVISIPRNSYGNSEHAGSEADNSEGEAIQLRNQLKQVLAECSRMSILGGCQRIVTWEEAEYQRQENGTGWSILVKMELLTPLTEAISVSMDEKTVVKLAKDLCEALQACEKQGIVHRDIQPGNIFVSASGAYKLGDFGVGKTGAELPREFRAPETGNQLCAASHVYSLGRVLYWLLNGQHLAPDAAASEPASGSPELRRIVMKACAEDAGDRYANASELWRALDSLKTPVVGPVIVPGGTTEPETGAGGASSGSGSGDAKGTGALDRAIKILASVAAVGILGVAAALVAGAFACDHQWTAATCQTPSRCILCEETSGVLLAHTWLEADCVNPQRCGVCGETQGAALGHAWLPPTLEAPQTCEVCGVTEGDPLEPEWVYINELDFVDKYGKLWTRSEDYPNVYTNTDYHDMNTPGHITGPVYDHMGNRYTYGLHVDLGGPASRYYVSYDLDGKYTTFSAVCSMAAERKGTSSSKYFEIYCDGVLVYTSRTMTDGVQPQSFTIDVTGVQTLRIQYPATKGENSIATVFDGRLSQ